MIRSVLQALSALIYWRPAVCVAATCLLAVILVWLFPWFDGLPGIFVAVSGVIPGVVWHAVADRA